MDDHRRTALDDSDGAPRRLACGKTRLLDRAFAGADYLPIRGVIVATATGPIGLVPVQILDGIGAGLLVVATPGLVALWNRRYQCRAQRSDDSAVRGCRTQHYGRRRY